MLEPAKKHLVVLNEGDTYTAGEGITYVIEESHSIEDIANMLYDTDLHEDIVSYIQWRQDND